MKQKIESRLLSVNEYAGYVALSPGTVYNQISQFFRKGSTAGLFIKPTKVGSGQRGIRFDKKKLDQALDEA